MKKRITLLLVALMLLATLAISLYAAPATDPAELNQVNATAVQMTEDNVFAAGGTLTGITCPYCNQPATWKPMTAKTTTGASGISGHYYLASDLTSNKGYYIPSGGSACVHLNGHSIKTTNAYAFAGSGTASYHLNIMGNGNVEGAGSGSYGTIWGQGTVRLFGGTYTATGNYYVVSASSKNANVYMFDGVTINGKTSATSAIICASAGAGSNFYLYGGTINVNKGTGFYLTTGTVHLAGVTVNATGGRGVYFPSGSATVNQSAGSITGASKCNVYMEGGTGTYTLSGGSISGGSGAYLGSNVRVKAGQFNMSGGSITGGSTTATGGGNVCVEGTGQFNMTGGEISGGSGGVGGNVYLNSADASFTLSPNTDSTVKPVIADGTATTSGGNIFVTAGALNVQAGEISGGTASGTEAGQGGGSIYLNGGTMDVTGGTITGGAAANGGNVFVGAGTLTLDGGTITKGTANGAANSSRHYINGGGNIYVNDSNTAKAYIKSGTVSNGTATNNGGGNILCNTKGTLSVSGGTISGGKAGYLGGNILNGLSSNVTISGGTITGGTSNTGKHPGFYYGDNITCASGTTTISGGTIESKGDHQGQGILVCYAGTLILDGDAKITNTRKTGNIFVSNHLSTSQTPKLKVNSTFTGEAGVAFNNETLVLGGTITSTKGSSTGAYTGTVYSEQLDGVGIVGTAENTLVVASILVNNVWYLNGEAAMAAVAGDAMIKPYTAADLPLKGATYMVDLNGQNVNITGSGSVTCYDSANDDYTANGSATINGQVDLLNTTMTDVNGKQYVKLVNDDTYTFHRLDMRVNGAYFRPSEAGIYYTSIWNCDDTLKGAMENFGVALGLNGMPVDEASLEFCLYTVESMDDFESGKTQNSVILQNIFTEDAWNAEMDNAQRGELPIFAAPYVYLKNNDSLEYLFFGGVSMSLQDVVKVLDSDEYYFENLQALESFNETWGAAMTDWGFQNIGKVLGNNPGEDGKLQLFMMGNSFTYYYVEELYALLDETEKAKYPNGIEIYNLYHSGSDVKNHYDWWINGEAEYQFFKTDSTGRNELTPSSGTGWTLEQGLAVGNWDYIGIQPSTTSLKISFNNAIGKDDAEMAEHMAPAIACVEPLLYHFHYLFPDAQILWQRSWAPELGRVSGSTTYNAENIKTYDEGLQRIQDYWCNVYDLDKPFDLKMVNSGATWTVARALNEQWKLDHDGASLIPEIGGLCARLGVVNTGTYPPGEGHSNPGDGYHDGNIGGGQLLNAYRWYMTITDKSVRDSAYIPDYGHGWVLSDDLVALLKEATMSVPMAD